MSEQALKLYALLIGIDGYKPNPIFKHLKGAVRDINLVADFLQKSLHLNPDHLYKLTSPNPALGVASNDPLPTYENIVNTFEKLTAIAQPNDQVYIHYSGHGAQIATIYPELKGQGQYDEGIAPTDLGMEGRYLRDVELATLLKRMTDKGLVVTVVFDCCNSGGATRGDCEIRGAESPDTTPRSQDSLVASREDLMQTWRSLTDGTQTNTLLPQSRDYVFLAACRPSEFAYEYAVNRQERHGALTYWMVDTLSNTPTGMTYRSLYNRINAKIQSQFLQRQLPMLMGDSNRQVFGLDQLPGRYAVTVLDADAAKNQVRLSAGLAQGLSRGTQFAVYGLGTTEFSNQNQIALVEVSLVRSSDAFAQLVMSEDGGTGQPISSIEPGAPAIMVSAPVELVRKVRLFEKTVGDGEAELPAELAGQQRSHLDAIRQAMQKNGWVNELAPEETEEAHYQVAIAAQASEGIAPGGTYEICAVGRPIENLRPPLNVNDAASAEGVVKRLVHLAKYEAVKALDNPRSNLANYLEVELLRQNGWQPGMQIEAIPFDDPSNITVQEGEYVFLRIKNIYQKPLNVAILDLEPTWEISQIPVIGLESSMYSFQRNEEQILPLGLQLPQMAGYEQATEIVKVFATLGSADFDWLTLPSLDEVIAPRGATRGIKSALGNLLEAIGGDADSKPAMTRAAVRVSDPNQEWVTKQVVVTVTR
ncbi:MAG: caspase family protein [Myxacorys chilensis ATA2-1-KO14]|nr:caspase family protein [Myxacorys chilensis ATA2-1-KO14]